MSSVAQLLTMLSLLWVRPTLGKSHFGKNKAQRRFSSFGKEFGVLVAPFARLCHMSTLFCQWYFFLNVQLVAAMKEGGGAQPRASGKHPQGQR
jgi:hypothetical protein